MTQALSRLIVGKKENISDELLLLNPYQIPILNLVGFGSPVTNTQYGWVEDKLQSMKDIVKGEKTNSDTTITVEDGSIFRADQVIRIGEELLLVTAVNDKDITVTRGFGETTAETIADKSVVEIMFNLKDEGTEAREGQYKPRVNLFNFTQIFDDTVKISGTAQAVSQYGITDLYLYEKMKVQDRLALELENAIVNGIRYQKGDKRMMGGLRSFIKTNVVQAKNKPLSYEIIDNAMLEIVRAGGLKDATRHAMVVSPAQRQVLALLDSDKNRVTQETNSFGRKVDVFVTNYGNLPIITNVNFKEDELAILDANRIQVRPLQGRDFSHTYLGITGDNVKGQIVGEYTLEVTQEEAHAWIKGLKITG